MACARLVSRRLQRGLKPVFETRVRRTIYPLYPLGRNGCSIEMAVDRGRIETGRHATTLSEVELELKGSGEAILFGIAHELIKTVPARLVLRSKAEQGYRLIENNVGSSHPDFTRDEREGCITCGRFRMLETGYR
jgi:triphosphatase